jgi:ferredoxin
LDAIPNGFPTTESGVELRLLAKIFTPDEAALAAVMRYAREPAADIAARAGIEPAEAYRMLKRMARKGQVRFGRREGQLLFGLLPFVIGIYEEQLPRMDRELAELFEEYLQETQGAGVAREAPAINRIIPVGEAVAVDLEVFPHEQATELLESAQAWGVRECICRLQQKLVGKGCDHATENCLVFAPVPGFFNHSRVDRPITKEEALKILHEAEEAGLVHTAGNFRDRHSYICNCCTCCCALLRSVAEFGAPAAIARSDFEASVDAASCIGCGECVERCQFAALSVPDDVSVVDPGRCVGCGVCAVVCPTEALKLERRPEGEVSPPPENFRDWMTQRARRRELDIAEML